MSSSSYIPTLNFIAQQITIYAGLIILIVGIIGGCLNVLVFLSLRTFRESSCAIHLIIMSIFNIGQLLTGLLSRIMTNGYGIDWTQTSLFYCKTRVGFVTMCMMISLTSVCLATIDQYWATSTNNKWQQWCNTKLASYLNIISMIIWLLHGIPYVLYYNHTAQASTGKITCSVTNPIFQQYQTYVITPIVARIIPLTVTFIFGLLAYRNVKQIAYRTVPLVRRELDKQLTKMVLVQVVFTCFAISPYCIVYILIQFSDLTKDLERAAQFQLANTIVICLYYIYFASPFYIYFTVSERFRRQFTYVLIRKHLDRWCRQRMIINQVTPQI